MSQRIVFGLVLVIAACRGDTEPEAEEAIATQAAVVPPAACLPYDPSKVANPLPLADAGPATSPTAGSFDVAIDGSARYSIPLEVLPGPGGLAPSLSLTYSSTRGNGIVGVGFAIDGESSIARCPKTIVYDGVAEAVHGMPSDPYCLDGQRLVLVSGVHGTHGAEYRTVPDSLARVVAYRTSGTTVLGPTNFRVWTRDGLVKDYGLTAAAPFGNFYQSWPLSKVADRSGNEMTYEYVTRMNGIAMAERRLVAIRYGLGKDREVTFAYEPRFDKLRSYTLGYEVGTDYRLSRIATRRREGTTWTEGRSYSLQYISGGTTSRSRLERVTECGVGGTGCKQPTWFSWQYGGWLFESGVDQAVTPPSLGGTPIITLDANGDERTDIAYVEGTTLRTVLGKPSGTNPFQQIDASSPGVPGPAFAVDYDIDGNVDILPRDGGATWRPLLARNNAFVAASTTFTGPLNDPNGHAWFGDFDGDGLQDVLEMKPDGFGFGTRFYVKRRSGALSTTVDAPSPSDAAAFEPHVELVDLKGLLAQDIFVLDHDGDGTEEIFFWKEGFGGMHALGAGANFQFIDLMVHGPSLPQTLSASIRLRTKVFADLNGDGLLDIISDGLASPSATLQYALNTGRGFTPFQDLGYTTTFSADTAGLRHTLVTDFDGDGTDDLLIPAGQVGGNFVGRLDLVYTKRSNVGDAVLATAASGITFVSRAIDSPSYLAQGPRLIDAAGDRIDDVLVVNYFPTRFTVFRHKGNGLKPELLTSISDGANLGFAGSNTPATVTLSYAALTPSTVAYTKHACTRVTGTSCAPGAHHVVVEVRRDGGTPTNETVLSNYTYADARVEKLRRVSLGFAERMVTTRWSSGGPVITTRSFYTNTDGMRDPALVEEWTFADFTSGSWLKRTQRTNVVKSTGKSYFIYPSEEVVSSYELGGGGPSFTILARSAFDGLGLVPFARTRDRSLVVDDYANVLQRRIDYGVAGNNYTAVTTTFAHDVANWLITRTARISTQDANTDHVIGERTVEYEYPTSSDLPSKMRSFGSAAVPGLVETYTMVRDAAGNVTRANQVAANGDIRQTCTTYDPDGVYPHVVVDHLGHASYVRYHPLVGEPSIEVDANGLRTDRTYDRLGRWLSTRAPSGALSTATYDLEETAAERLARVSVTESTGRTTERVFDRRGRLVTDRFVGFDGAKRHRTIEYDPYGRVKRATNYAREATGSTDAVTITYDSLDRPRQVTEPGAQVRRFDYAGATRTATNTRGHKTRWTLDERGQLARVTEGFLTAAETTRTFAYAPFGNLSYTSVDGVAGSREAFLFDAGGRLLKSEDNQRGVTTFAYNGFGDTATITDARGQTTTFLYDAIGRTVERATLAPGGSLVARELFTWDTAPGKGIGRPHRIDRTEAPATTHRMEYTYDGFGRVSALATKVPSETVIGMTETFHIGYTRDIRGRLIALTFPAVPGAPVNTVTYAYQPTGHLDRVQSGLDVLWKNVGTDAVDRLVAETTGDGVTMERTFDWRNAVNSIQVKQGTTLFSALQYARDGEGNLTARVDKLQNLSEQFTYDPLDRLLDQRFVPSTKPPQTWAYDRLGNITNASSRGVYTYDPNRPFLVTALAAPTGTKAFSYDAIGNQIRRPGLEITYNDLNLPDHIDDAATDDLVASFNYGADGRRARKWVRGSSTTYVGGIYERRRVNGETEHHLLVPALGRTVAVLRFAERTGGTTRLPTLYPHPDHLGSVDTVTATATGMPTIVERKSYDAYGLPRSPSWLSTAGPTPPILAQGFTGHEDDDELGLVDMKGRLYDPLLGRFLTADPFVSRPWAVQGWNRYAYVENNPLSYTDPTGFSRAAPVPCEINHSCGGGDNNNGEGGGPSCVLCGFGNDNLPGGGDGGGGGDGSGGGARNDDCHGNCGGEPVEEPSGGGPMGGGEPEDGAGEGDGPDHGGGGDEPQHNPGSSDGPKPQIPAKPRTWREDRPGASGGRNAANTESTPGPAGSSAGADPWPDRMKEVLDKRRNAPPEEVRQRWPSKRRIPKPEKPRTPTTEPAEPDPEAPDPHIPPLPKLPSDLWRLWIPAAGAAVLRGLQDLKNFRMPTLPAPVFPVFPVFDKDLYDTYRTPTDG